MNAEEYERFVENVISSLSAFHTATVKRNIKLDGVRQPGRYQIDVLMEMVVGGVTNFRMIIECKNWSKPVDRPVIQKIAQTRDALSIEKAAVVSPLGFTKEAVSVAKSLGIALWVLSKTVFCVLSLCDISGDRDYNKVQEGYFKHKDIEIKTRNLYSKYKVPNFNKFTSDRLHLVEFRLDGIFSGLNTYMMWWDFPVFDYNIKEKDYDLKLFAVDNIVCHIDSLCV